MSAHTSRPSVYDGAGRVLAEQSSAEGAVVLVVDAPLAAPRIGGGRH